MAFGANFRGMGVALMARDFGLTAKIKEVDKGLLGLRKGMEGINKLSFSNVGEKVDEYSKKVTESGNSAMDAMEEIDHTFATWGATYKITSDQLDDYWKRARKTSLYTAAATSDLVETTNQLMPQYRDLSKIMGLLEQGGADMIKAMQLKPDDVAEFYRLTKHWDMAPEEIARMRGEWVALGGALGDTNVIFRNMPKLMKKGEDSLVALGFGGAKGLERLTTGLVGVASGMVSAGETPEEAIGKLDDFVDRLAESRVGIAKMVVGLKTDLPAGMEEMATVMGDANKSFDLLQKSPEQFMMNLMKLAQATRGKNFAGLDKDLDATRLWIEDTFGPEVTKYAYGHQKQMYEGIKRVSDKSMRATGKDFDDYIAKLKEAKSHQVDLARNATEVLKLGLARNELSLTASAIATVVDQAKLLGDFYGKFLKEHKILGGVVTNTSDAFGGLATAWTGVSKSLDMGVGSIITTVLAWKTYKKMGVGSLKGVGDAVSELGVGKGSLLGLLKTNIKDVGKVAKDFGTLLLKGPAEGFKGMRMGGKVLSDTLLAMGGSMMWVAGPAVALALGYGLGTLAMKYLGLGKVTGWATDKLEGWWNKSKEVEMGIKAQEPLLNKLNRAYGKHFATIKEAMEYQKNYQAGVKAGINAPIYAFGGGPAKGQPAIPASATGVPVAGGAGVAVGGAETVTGSLNELSKQQSSQAEYAGDKLDRIEQHLASIAQQTKEPTEVTLNLKGDLNKIVENGAKGQFGRYGR